MDLFSSYIMERSNTLLSRLLLSIHYKMVTHALAKSKITYACMHGANNVSTLCATVWAKFSFTAALLLNLV